MSGRITVSREAIAGGLKRLAQQLLSTSGPVAQATMVTAPILDEDLQETGKTVQLHISCSVALVGRANAQIAVPMDAPKPGVGKP